MTFYFRIPLLFLFAFSLTASLWSQTKDRQQMESQEERKGPYQEDLLKDFSEFPLVEVERQPVESESENFQTKFFHMLVILGLLIGFMILASWSLKRMMRSRVNQLNTSSSIKVLDTRYLSPRATLYLIEVENQAYLIAESPTVITHIALVPLAEEIQKTPSNPPKFSL